jgi:hypothetical protein
MHSARVGEQVTIVTVLWIVVFIVPQAVNMQTAAAQELSLCVKSQKITSMLSYAPYALRAKDVQIVIPTVNKLYDIQTSFFEVDNRTTNRFSLAINGNTVSGVTCWVGYSVVFNNPQVRSAFK